MSTPEPEVCPQCGQAHVTRRGNPACIRHCSGGQRPEIAGKPCGNDPMHGQKVCAKHGGRSPRAKAAAEKRIAEAESEEELQRIAVEANLGRPIDGMDPADVIMERIAIWRGHVDFFLSRARARTLGDDLVWGPTKEKHGGEDYGTTWEAKPNIWWAMYDRASERLEKLCLDAMRAGFEQRRVQLAEKQGQIVERLLQALIVELGHDPEDQQVAEAVERSLHLVTGTG